MTSTRSERSQPQLVPVTTYVFKFEFPFPPQPVSNDEPRPSSSAVRDALKHDLREGLTEALRKMTRDPKACMRWTAAGFLQHVVKKYEVTLEGWGEDVPFENLSNLPNAIKHIRDLLDSLEKNELRFIKISRATIRGLTAETASPGKYVPPRERATRRDFKWHKVARRRPGRTLTGPKSDEFVYDSDEIEEFGDSPQQGSDEIE